MYVVPSFTLPSGIFQSNGIGPYFAKTIVLSLIPLIFSIVSTLFWVIVYYKEYGREAFEDSFYKREI